MNYTHPTTPLGLLGLKKRRAIISITISMDFLTQLFTILTGPEGTLFFHLILAFAVLATLQGAYAQWRATEFPQTRRTVMGLAILIGAQALLFLVSALLLNGLGDPRVILPPLGFGPHLVFDGHGCPAARLADPASRVVVKVGSSSLTTAEGGMITVEDDELHRMTDEPRAERAARTSDMPARISGLSIFSPARLVGPWMITRCGSHRTIWAPMETSLSVKNMRLGYIQS